MNPTQTLLQPQINSASSRRHQDFAGCLFCDATSAVFTAGTMAAPGHERLPSRRPRRVRSTFDSGKIGTTAKTTLRAMSQLPRLRRNTPGITRTAADFAATRQSADAEKCDNLPSSLSEVGLLARSLVDSVEKLNALDRMTLHASAVCRCIRSKSV